MSKQLIFIVEDDHVFNEFINNYLEQIGYNNRASFHSGEDCIASLGDKPAFIFLDFSMSGLNGLDTLKKIKKQLPKTKVFILTSLNDNEVKNNCLSNGATLYIVKDEILNGFPTVLTEHLKKASKGGFFG